MGSHGQSGTSAEIERHRKAISAIDETFVRLLARRTRRVMRIWALKEQGGHPLVDEAQERIVRKRARGFARKHGLDPDMAEEVLAEVLAHGKKAARKYPRGGTGVRAPVRLKRNR